jgi:hypothetical protein
MPRTGTNQCHALQQINAVHRNVAMRSIDVVLRAFRACMIVALFVGLRAFGANPTYALRATCLP